MSEMHSRRLALLDKPGFTYSTCRAFTKNKKKKNKKKYEKLKKQEIQDVIIKTN